MWVGGTEKNIRRAFEEAEEDDAIPRLAPGDFRTVRQSLHYLAGEPTNAMRLGGLENESRLKKDGRGSGSIGF